MSQERVAPGLRHAAGLCWVAGFVDAVGYFQFGHVFTANMTGNTVLLGTSLVRLDPIAFSYAGTLIAFGLGVVAAVLIKRRHGGLAMPFWANAGLLGVLAVAPLGPAEVLMSLAFAMGMQGGTIATFSGIRLPTVVVTSTLVNLIEGLVLRVVPRGVGMPGPMPSEHLRHLAVAWAAYGIGGGSAVPLAHSALSFVVPAVMTALIAADLGRAK